MATMKLLPGTCGLCAVGDQVVSFGRHKKIATFMPETLKSYIGIPKIEEISSKLQVCSFCLAHMLQVVQYEENLGTFSTLNHGCSICRNVEHLVNITEWSQFDILLENINAKRGKKCTVCLPCIAYLEQLNLVKEHFLKSVSKLQIARSPIRRNQKSRNKVPRGKEGPDYQSKPHNGLNVELKPTRKSKRTKTELALNHLKPLKHSDFKVDEYKNDARLLDQIAFVSLKGGLSDTQVKKPRKNQTREKTTNIRIKPVFTVAQSPFKIRLKSSNKTARKSPKKQVTLEPRISKTKRGRKAHQNNPKTKQLIIRILKANVDELIHRAQHDGDEAKLSTEADVEIKSQSNDEKKVLFMDELKTSDKTLNNDLLENTLSELITNEENSAKNLKRKRLFSNQTPPEESNSEIESNELDSLSVKRLKIDAIHQANNDASGPFDPFDALRSAVKVSENNVLEQPLAINGKESQDASSLEITLADLENHHDEDNSSSCSEKTEFFTDNNQAKGNESKEMKGFSTLHSEIEITDSKLESSNEDTIVTLADFRKSLDVTSSTDTECDSDIVHSQLIKENSEEELTDKNEKPLEAENDPEDVEYVEPDNCEEHSAKYVEDEDGDDDCLPDGLHRENEVTDSKLESSSKDRIVTLAEFRELQSSLDVTSSGNTECGSDIENSQLIKENSATHEEELTDKNEKPLGAPKDVENAEADRCEEHNAKSVEDEDGDDDCLPDGLHLDSEPTKDDNSTCTPTNEGSDLV